MRSISHSLRLLMWLGFLGLRPFSCSGQELVVDQATGSLEDPLVNGVILPGSFAQSFTPLLPSIDFIQVSLVVEQTNALTFYFNLREGGPNSPIFASTVPAVLSNRGTEKKTFYFPNSVPLILGNIYFFEPVDASKGLMNINYLSPSSYTRGDLWSNGVKDPDADLWFREGVIVPEPSALLLVNFGGLILLLVRHQRPARKLRRR
jgi:hypothetical protein